ncbi:MAG TPA: PIG-L family deacetylase [Gemmatimonadales bacterium]|nr:PIG-L family deacetylase [Gemmatimonadales bacterium]
MRLAFSLALACLLTPLAGRLHAQLEPPGTGGVVALDQELRMLGHYRRVLMIGAHPDDEDTELLTVLVRGMGAEAAYLSLNRGEGGQNLIGPELGEALGLIRTEELLAARRLDGARQYFTRAYDFGYAKTLEETWEHWPRDTILKDVVRIVRRFRPQIIVSVFSGLPRDGHGQHQAAGWIAREAFDAAGDSTRFTELAREEGIRVWTPLKLYRSTRFDTAATTLRLDGGVLDRSVGKSYHQIAMAGRSLHRSQDMGRLQRIGPSEVPLALEEDRTAEGGGGLFDGIDTSLAAMPWRDAPRTDGPAARRRFAARADSARAALGSGAYQRVVALLDRGKRDLLPQSDDSRAQLLFSTPEQADQRRHTERALGIAAGLVADALSQDQRLVPGQSDSVGLVVWNTGSDSMTVAGGVVPSAEWHVAADSNTQVTLAPGAVHHSTAMLSPDTAASATTPYFLRRPRQGSLYDWSGVPATDLGEPFGPSAPVARFGRLGPGGETSREVTQQVVDQALGEVRRPVTVVPRVDVKLDPANYVWSLITPGSRRFTVTLTHGARDTTTGTVSLVLPKGWPSVRAQRFRLVGEDERETFTFDVRAPRASGRGSATLRAVATDSAGREYDAGVFTVSYPHIRPRSYVMPAASEVHLAPVALPTLTRIGYIRGASDLVPEALQRAGLPVTLLDALALERDDLSRFPVIVIGPRAYETDSALVENNPRILAYVRAGGVLIVQYQQHKFFTENFAPLPLTVGGPRLEAGSDSGRHEVAGSSESRPDSVAEERPVSHDRVVDERAPITILAPDHAVLRRPNRISELDWEGWVQERGLYFARSWDPGYSPILETHDEGEAPLEGGLLVATVGRGTYVYTGLSFFRQLPAGVPGALRLFANLLALGQPAAR